MSNLWKLVVVVLRKITFAAVICFAGVEAHDQWGKTDPDPRNHELEFLLEIDVWLWSAKFAALFLLTAIIAAVIFHGSQRLNPGVIDFALLVLWCLITMLFTVNVKLEG